MEKARRQADLQKDSSVMASGYKGPFPEKPSLPLSPFQQVCPELTLNTHTFDVTGLEICIPVFVTCMMSSAPPMDSWSALGVVDYTQARS